MGKEAEIAEKFWDALRSDRTLMLGLAGVDEGHAQPMTALLEGDRDGGPVWIFSAKNVDLVMALAEGRPAIAHFVSKGHDLFATFRGMLTVANDRAQIWLNENSLIAGIKLMLGRDPKKEYKDKVAEVELAG